MNKKIVKEYGLLEILINPTITKDTEVFATLCTINKRTDVQQHVHDYSKEHVYVIEGEAELIINGKSYYLKQGECKVIPIGVPHTINNKSNSELKALLIMTPLAPKGYLGHRNVE